MSCAHEWRIEYAPVGVCSKCREREEEVDAYRRGAEAMREACARAVEDADDGAPLQMLADDGIRALPIPEDKP